MAVQSKIEIRTGKGPHISDVTYQIQKIAENMAQGRVGIIHIYLTGTTASLIINENETELIEDIKQLYKNIAPEGIWRHDSALSEGNAHSHLRNILTGCSVSVPFDGKKLLLGTWQKILLVEWDTRPRNRTLIITFID